MQSSAKPTLGYWKIRGLAHQIRMQLHYSGVDFSDVMYAAGPAPEFNREEWLTVKETLGLPFPNLPYFIDGDVKITETAAIHRYIANKWMPELCGKTTEDKGQVDMIWGVINDLKGSVTGPCYMTGDKAEIIKQLTNRVPSILTFMGDKKFLVGDYITIADFFFYEILAMTQ
jgi:glutathione S-transferase